VRKLLCATTLLAGAAGIAWWYWKSSTRAGTEAWAAGTDTID
jgi:hypothetical protein